MVGVGEFSCKETWNENYQAELKLGVLLLACPFLGPPSDKLGFRSSVRKTVSRGREDTRVWYQETIQSRQTANYLSC